jgi:hypothetical protein
MPGAKRAGKRTRFRLLCLFGFFILVGFLITPRKSTSSSLQHSATTGAHDVRFGNQDERSYMKNGIERERISNSFSRSSVSRLSSDDIANGDDESSSLISSSSSSSSSSSGSSSRSSSNGGSGSGGPKRTRLFRNMFKDGFNGDFIMTQQKYSKLARNSPIRVAKYMSQCLSDSPPRGCDLEAAKADPPRGRGWQRVARITKELLHEFPVVDTRFKGFQKYKSCAIVGNGGSLRLKKYGKYIDEADAVIRFNGGPTTNGLSDYVGSKTTIRFLNTQYLGFHESKKEILLQHVTVEETMQKFINFKKRFNGDIYVIDGDFHQLVLDTMEDGAASNGFYGLLFGLERCEKVTLWGFAKGWNKPTSDRAKLKYHYYDDVEPNESQLKRDDLEAPKVAKFVAKHSDIFEYGEMSH